MLMGHHKTRLFVKSVKTVTGTEEFEHITFAKRVGGRRDRFELEGKVMNGTFRIKAYQKETEPVYEFILSEEQQEVVEMVKEAASEQGLEVEVIDVTKENVLHRAIQKELEKIRTFPTLIASSGEKIEGKMTKEQIESVLSPTC
jgi:ABC-type uncharacterized transport system substrate-binding protein